MSIYWSANELVSERHMQGRTRRMRGVHFTLADVFCGTKRNDWRTPLSLLSVRLEKQVHSFDYAQDLTTFRLRSTCSSWFGHVSTSLNVRIRVQHNEYWGKGMLLLCGAGSFWMNDWGILRCILLPFFIQGVCTTQELRRNEWRGWRELVLVYSFFKFSDFNDFPTKCAKATIGFRIAYLFQYTNLFIFLMLFLYKPNT